MDRLVGKNILIIIPKDYYMESEFDPVFEAMTAEGATVLVASSKLKEAVGMKNGRTNPDVLIVDAMERRIIAIAAKRPPPIWNGCRCNW